MEFNINPLIKKINGLRALLRLTPSGKIVLTCSLFLMAGCISYVYSVYPRKKVLCYLDKSLKEETKILEKSQSALTEYEEVQSRALTSEKRSPWEMLFTPDGVLNFYEEFSSIVLQSHNQLDSLNPVSGEIPSPQTFETLSQNDSFNLQEFSFRVVVEGKFETILDLLRKIERYDKLISINEFQIKTAESGYPALQAEFTLTLYLL